MKVVGSDLGAFTRESWVESVVLGPAERYVVQVRFDRPGHGRAGQPGPRQSITGSGVTSVRPTRWASCRSAVRRPPPSPASRTLRADTVTAREIRRGDGRRRVACRRASCCSRWRRTCPILRTASCVKDSVFFNSVEWSGTMPGMNWAATTSTVRWFLSDPATGLEDMAIDWRFKAGDRIRLRLGNDRTVFHGMQHPVHIHGQRFVVLAVNGVPNDNPVWKDTVLLPAGGTVDLLLELTNPGRWMLHCHIAEHLEAGMMMAFEVRSVGAAFMPPAMGGINPAPTVSLQGSHTNVHPARHRSSRPGSPGAIGRSHQVRLGGCARRRHHQRDSDRRHRGHAQAGPDHPDQGESDRGDRRHRIGHRARGCHGHRRHRA